MRYSAAVIAVSALALGTPASAQVREPAPDFKVSPAVQVLERNARGLATKVRVGETTYDVCMNDRQDTCIQPRAAGLGFGETPLAYWPNEPVSSRR